MLYRSDLATVRQTLKSGKNLEQSEATVRKYLADTLFNNDVKLHAMLCDVLKRAYEVGNEKMYLKEKTDTLCLVNTTKRMYRACEHLDSLDDSYRRRNAAYLVTLRPNVFMGGIFFLQKKKWSDAWDSFDLYLDCLRQPLFSASGLTKEEGTEKDEALTNRVAFLSLVTANRLDSLPLALKYAERSTRSADREQAYEILSEMSLAHSDSAHAYQYLSEGFNAFSTSEYFYPNILSLLCSKGQYDEALKVSDRALAADSLNAAFVQGKHIVLMNLGRYGEAVEWGDKAISLNDSLDAPHYNVGYVYYQRAQNAMKIPGKSYRQRLARAQKYYERLLPYMERYRQLRPDDKRRWLPILYDAYLNLNMGEKFTEIMRIKG